MNNQQFKDVHAFTSKTILKVLGNEELEEENLFAFSIYMHFGIIKARSEKLSEAKNISQQVLKAFLASKEEDEDAHKDEAQFSSLFALNAEVLNDICNDVWSDSYSEDMIWLQDWINLCSKKNDGSIPPDETSIHLLDIVNDHLESGSRQPKLTLKLINKTLETV